MSPKSQKVRSFLGLAPPGAPLVAQHAFEHWSWVLSAPDVLLMIKNNDTEEPQDYKKELLKLSLFGAWPGGLREALTIIVHHFEVDVEISRIWD